MPRESTIQVFRSTTPSAVPSGLTQGEIAINLVDNALYYGGTAGQSVNLLGTSFASRPSFSGGLTADSLWVTNGATFAGRSSFNSGLSASNLWVTNGATFSSNTTFLSGIQTDSVFPTSGIGGTVYINSDAGGGGGNSITYIGDWAYDNNGTSIAVDDQSAAIYLNGAVVCNSTVHATSFITTGGVQFGAASASVNSQTTTLGTTAANQNIASVEIYDAGVDLNRSVEFFVQASHSSGYEALKVMAIHDGTNTYNTQYGLIRTGSSLCSSYTTTITNGGAVLRLRATPTNTNTIFKVVQTVIPA